MQNTILPIRTWWLLAVFFLWSLPGCLPSHRLNTYEKHVSIPDFRWDYNFHPSFEVNITDTAARYSISVTLRHTDAYAYSNLWLKVTSYYTGQRPHERRVELPLADKQGRWLGGGMDDIFDHRIPIQQNARFDKPGIYHFSFQQDMRINPLPHMMSVGLRIEKTAP